MTNEDQRKKCQTLLAKNLIELTAMIKLVSINYHHFNDSAKNIGAMIIVGGNMMKAHDRNKKKAESGG